MCASLTGASFPGWERRAAEGARGEKRPQPISIGDADDAAHILLAVTSGGRRARPSSFKPRAGVKGSPAVVEFAVPHQMKAGARKLPETCSSPLHPSSSTRESRPPAPSSFWSGPRVCTTPATTSPAIVFVFLVVCTKPAATLVLSPSSGSPSAVGKEPESAATPAPSRGREASRRSGGEGHDARFVFGGAAG